MRNRFKYLEFSYKNMNNDYFAINLEASPFPESPEEKVSGFYWMGFNSGEMMGNYDETKPERPFLKFEEED